MCLSVVDAETTKKTQGFGYKVIERHFLFSAKKPTYTFLFKSLNGTNVIRFRKWLMAEDCTFNKGITADDGKLYLTGFHVYKNKKDALKDVYGLRHCRRVVRVQYRKVKASGLQEGRPVVVADEIKFLNIFRISIKELRKCA